MFKKIVNVIEILALGAAGVFVLMLVFADPSATTSGAVDGANAGGGTAYLPDTGALPTGGEELYLARCAGCHGRDGDGGSGPRLAGQVTESFPDIDDQIALVKKGRGGMPSFGALSDADIQLVVEYTRTGLGS